MSGGRRIWRVFVPVIYLGLIQYIGIEAISALVHGAVRYHSWFLSTDRLFLAMFPSLLMVHVLANAAFTTAYRACDSAIDLGWTEVVRAQTINLASAWVVLYTCSVLLPKAFLSLDIGTQAGLVGVACVSAAVFAVLVYSAAEINPRDKKSGRLRAPYSVLLYVVAAISAVSLFAGIGLSISAANSIGLLYSAQRAVPWNIAVVVVLFFLVPYLFSALVDVNELSLHSMYRNSIVRAFLGASRERNPDPLTMFDAEDDLPLHALAAQRPFHVVNAAMKTNGESASAPFRRSTESFTFTPLFCGTESLGFRPTKSYAGSISLGNALAASGAAISPTLGQRGPAHIRLLMSLLNPKLGMWLVSPLVRDWKRRRPRFAFPVILNEIVEGGRSMDQNLYISDGGHFENLGLYEMVRRRCKVIVVVDATRDRLGSGDDLANAVSRIRTDFNVVVEIDTTALRASRGSAASRHLSMGHIRYPDKMDGILIYVKPILTGDEPIEVQNYAAVNSEFPHEATTDQFFSEAQFESYRLLGVHSFERELKLWSGPGLSFDQFVQRVYDETKSS